MIIRSRRFGAKPDKKIVDRSSGKSEFMEDTVHGNSDGVVVGVDRFWVVRAAGWAEWLSGGEWGLMALFRRTSSAVIALRPVGSGS
jgi:hypothetical protein